MPGSAYHKVAIQVAEWLSKVPEFQINSSTKMISDGVKEIRMKPDEGGVIIHQRSHIGVH